MKLNWQREDIFEREWISEIFSPYIEELVFDGQHKVDFDNCILAESYLHAGPPEYFAQFRGKLGG